MAMPDPQTCNAVRGIQILCKHEHEVEANTTFSCKEHNLQKHVFCSAYHGGKAPSPCDNQDIGNVRNDIGMHARADQAFSLAVITQSVYIRAYVEKGNITSKYSVISKQQPTKIQKHDRMKENGKMFLKNTSMPHTTI